jgi:hypothetical protein
MLAALTLAGVAAAAEPVCFSYGPTPAAASCQPVPERGPDGTAAYRLAFAPPAAGTDYWCGGGLIFPAPGAANELEFYVRGSTPRRVECKLLDQAGRAGQYALDVTTDWTPVRFRREFPLWLHEPARGPLGEIAKLDLHCRVAKGQAGQPFTLWLAGVRRGTCAPQPYRHPNWMPVKTPPPVPGYRIETCIHNIWGLAPKGGEFPGLASPKGLAMAEEVADHLLRDYGTVGITIAYLHGDNGRRFTDWFAARGGLPLAEGHNFPGKEFLEQLDALAVNIHGQKAVVNQFCEEDMTNPAVLEELQKRLLASAQAGAKAWRTVDYVWKYDGGAIWGYSPAAIKRWRENLAGTDAGLEIVDGAKTRVAHFGEYAQSYLGYHMTPADCGYTAWAQYQPPGDQEKASPQLANRQTLFNLLFHYEWVKYINEAARPSLPYGLKAQPICNPESFANGTDLAWLLRCANVRGIATEWWSSADTVVATYYSGRYYERIAATNGKELIFLGESAAAGGNPFYGKQGKPNYWDNQANYLITYGQAGAVDAKAKHDQYWGSSWKTMTNSAAREYQAYTAFRSAWCGFLQARNDRAVKPKTDVLALEMRPIAQDLPPFDRGPDGQPYNLARHLTRLNYLHDGAAFPVDQAFALEDYRTVIYTASEPPDGYTKKLAAWLDGAPDRTVVTHSFIPTRYAAPRTRLEPADSLFQAGGRERALGFTSIKETAVRSGVLKAHNPVFAQALGALNGRRVSFARGICAAPGGTVLVSLDGQPLVSERPCGRGRVIYLHAFANERGITGEPVERQLMDAIMRYLGQEPTALSPENVWVLRFDTPARGRVFLACKLDAPTDMALGGEIFSVYQAAAPAVTGEFRARVPAANADYRVTNLITGVATTQRSDAHGYLRVSYTGWNMLGVYVERVQP